MMSLILVLIRLFVGGIFVYSGWHKLMAPVENFMAVLQGYQFLPFSLVPIFAFLVPWMEFIMGSFLVLGFMTRTSSAVLGVFLMVFIALLARSLWLHLPIHECGCFGAGITLSPQQAIALDSGLLSGALILMVKGRWLRFSLDRWLNKNESHIKRV
jgi:uncharacterized membrane protein YphA (DoxX/SURF4 family)